MRVHHTRVQILRKISVRMNTNDKRGEKGRGKLEIKFTYTTVRNQVSAPIVQTIRPSVITRRRRRRLFDRVSFRYLPVMSTSGNDRYFKDRFKTYGCP